MPDPERPFCLLVAGSRDMADYDLLRRSLDSLLRNRLSDVVILHGGAPGADSLAGRYARERGLACEVFEARWGDIERPGALVRRRRDGSLYDALAGPLRNQRMLDEGRPDAAVLFPSGGPGTRDMLARVETAGIRFAVFPLTEGA